MSWQHRLGSPRLGSIALALVMVGLLTAPGPAQEVNVGGASSEGSVISGPEQVVQNQVEAYNRHDIEAFLKTYSPKIKLYDFPDKESASGLEALRERYGKLFKREPDLKVRIVDRIVQGDRVIDQEEVSVGGRQFKAVAIYQVNDGKITAVWFLK
ncbi:nuclear transport factor 2 family protein [Singulisphaera sp. Ch08]|uniref:Nuclear transport factor 2 family protein n=1 Tax=Singulisphaera sp. Ch08 TaxID=3120278 RepID=A0AAU7CDA4_9BACT